MIPFAGALELTRAETDDFVAGAFVGDQPGAAFNDGEYLRQMEMIQHHGGTPVIFQSLASPANRMRPLWPATRNSRVTRMLWLV